MLFGLIRNLLALFGLIMLVYGGYAYALYDTVDPCKVLAAKRSQEQIIAPLSEAFGGDGDTLGDMDDLIESLYRALQIENSVEDCAGSLINVLWSDITGQESAMAPEPPSNMNGDMSGDAPADPE